MVIMEDQHIWLKGVFFPVLIKMPQKSLDGKITYQCDSNMLFSSQGEKDTNILSNVSENISNFSEDSFSLIGLC